VKALVAGGAGFIGSHLCRTLILAGHQVVCVDNLSSGQAENIGDLMDAPGFSFALADITEIEPAGAPGYPTRIGDHWAQPPDVVLHLASPASPVDYAARPLETLAANSVGTWRLLDLARTSGARFIYASTSEVYGDPLVHPQPESYFGNVDPVGPRSMYDEGKRFGESLVTAYRSSWGVKAAIVRIFNTYGPDMRLDDGRVVPAFLSAALSGASLEVQGDGRQTRSYMYVSDLVAGLLRVASDPELDGLVVNIGNPGEVSVLSLARRIILVTGSESGIVPAAGRPGDPRQRCPDIGLMIRRYGWVPRIDLDEGLGRTVESYR